MSNTPKTDSFAENWDSYNFPNDAIDFARQLERECQELREALARMANSPHWSREDHVFEARAILEKTK